jgi:hypothetical protein
MYIFIKVFSWQICLYDFHISKLNDLKVIHDLYFQYLTQILSKTTSNTEAEGVYCLDFFVWFILQKKKKLETHDIA